MSSASPAQPPQTDEDSAQASRKRKRQSERARATRACDRCKKRKIRCNGTQPCEVCTRAAEPCTYDSAYTRGRAPTITRVPDLITVEDACAAETLLHHPNLSATESTLPSGWADPQTHAFSHSSHTQSSLGNPGISSQSSPEPAYDDSQGQYIGPTSGVSFLLRVQKRLHQAISISQASTIFTFGDAPLQLPEFDPSFCMMLPRDDAQRLVDRYFDFAMPTYRFLHRPTIQKWFVEFYETLGIMRDPNTAPAKIAMLFMVLAHARVYMPENDLPGPSDLSTRYFLAAEHQLTKERGSVRLTSVQARLIQCYYLLTQSRINHCWSLFGTVSHLALAIGLNRNTRADPTSESSIIDVECRRRTFWCAYTLDAFLSVALGRPRSFHDDDIDTELPACVDDDELTVENVNSSRSRGGLSMMMAPLAHIKIARIIGKIISGLYSIKPISTGRRAMMAERISKDLTEWRIEMARFLDADLFSTALLVPIFQRQRNVLNLTYWHAVILAHRPIVLSNFTRLLRRPDRNASIVDGQGEEAEESLQQCLGAAMSTVKTVQDMTQNRQIFRAFWITTYFAFTATIMLYIYVIQKRASPPEVYSSYFSAASRCQSHLSAIAEKGSLSERYCLVLEELRVETLRQARRVHAAADGGGPGRGVGGGGGMDDMLQQYGDSGDGGGGIQNASMPMEDSPNSATNFTGLLGEAPIDLNGMPASAFSDTSTGWGHFVAMISAGMGNLDAAFLSDESFKL
ncbi:transcriptional regulatory protein GAL4 [Xylariomycetidae sp. FL2044]|nr:transcriptional regulatory protein GAL4 [Xylariomycetidae sp. FL2044]